MKLRVLVTTLAAMGCTCIAAQTQTTEIEAAVPPASSLSAAEANQALAQMATQLPQAVEKAVLTHPEIRARANDFISTVEDQNIARAGWRPQVTAQGWVGKEWRSNLPNNAASYDWSRPGWSLDLRQLIFDAGRTSNNIRQLGFEKLSKYYELRGITDYLAFEAVAAYLDVQRYREMERLANDNFAMHQTTFTQLRERAESGVGRGVDLEQANGRVALAQSNLMTESNNLNDVTQRYRRVVGEYPAPVLEEVADPTASVPAPGSLTDFSEVIRFNPSLMSKQALVQAAQAGTKSAQAAHMPTLELLAGTGRDRDSAGPSNRDVQSSRVQLRLTYPLYRGGADSARIRQTLAQGDAAVDVRDYTCLNVQQELSVAWNNMTRLREQLPFLREHEMSTSKVRVAYQQQFQIGQRSLLDLLDTENELFDARRALINAQYDMKKAQFQWLMQANQILTALGLAQPHAGMVPDEHKALLLTEDAMKNCKGPIPDTRNLTPLMAYGKAAPVTRAAAKP